MVMRQVQQVVSIGKKHGVSAAQARALLTAETFSCAPLFIPDSRQKVERPARPTRGGAMDAADGRRGGPGVTIVLGTALSGGLVAAGGIPLAGSAEHRGGDPAPRAPTHRAAQRRRAGC
jgi:hypothetical protein